MPPLLAIPFPMIDPVLISLGPIVIRWYALAYIAGLFGGWWLARHHADNLRQRGMNTPTSQAMDDLILYVALGVILGGRIAYVMFYNPSYFIANPAEIIAIWKGGMSFHGGLMGAALALMICARKTNANVFTTLDIAACVAPMGLFFGRIANFINSELWGRVTDVQWGVIFPNGGPLPRHPSQLYEAALEGALLFIILQVLLQTKLAEGPGRLAGIFGIGYGLSRIICEFYREPDPQLGFIAGFLTMGMLLSLPLIIIGVWLLTRPSPNPIKAS
jgi:phosphatidylglycerol---prolipoprotein diacylglyceryl transferase